MRIIGLDIGERHTGVAISDATGTIARPLETVDHESREEIVTAVVALVAEHGADMVVAGRPVSLDGSIGPQARLVDRYAEELMDALDVPVILWDERYSTARADEVLLETRKKKARRKARENGEIDAIAAAVILQSYLDSQIEG